MDKETIKLPGHSKECKKKLKLITPNRYLLITDLPCTVTYNSPEQQTSDYDCISVDPSGGPFMSLGDTNIIPRKELAKITKIPNTGIVLSFNDLT